jgi:predicted aspartyl protease
MDGRPSPLRNLLAGLWVIVLAGTTLDLVPLASAASGPSASASDSAQPVQAPPSDTPAGAVRFDLYQGYCIVVHGSAGPLKNLNFVLDTGTIHSTFDLRIAKRLNLRDEVSTGMVFMSGRVQAENATLPSLQLGPIERPNLPIVIADISALQRFVPVRIDGILGLDVLGQTPFVIDYTAHVIRFGPSPALAISVPLRLDGGLAVFDAEIDHALVHLLFDTGASTLVLFKTDLGSSADATSRGIDRNGFENTPVRLGSVKVGLEEFRQRPALMARNPRPTQIDFDGMMSPAALGISRVSVDLERGVLTFSR